MSMRLMVFVVITIGWSAAGAAGQDVTSGPSPDTVALIGETAVTAAQLDELAGVRLARLRSEEYTIRKQVLDEYIAKTLLEREAKARGITVQELTLTEIDAKVVSVTDDQKRAVYESGGGRYAGQSEAEALALIESNLRQIRLAEARRRLISELRTSAGVRVHLESPRLAVDTAGQPAKGPRNAPVTIVEFSDFQCPYCRNAAQTLTRLTERYGDKVRLVFRDFPLPIHKEAPKAAEAAECANDQNKFWPMHDKIFENPSNLQPSELKRRAAEIELDRVQFDRCLDSGRHAARWQQDRADGQRYGVSVTPTFFINGRMLTGAAPYQALAEIIEEELVRSAEQSRKGVGSSPAARPQP